MKGGCDVIGLPLLQIFQSPHSASTTYWAPRWTVQGHTHTFGIFLLGFGFQFVLLCQSTNFFKESANKYFGKQYSLCWRRHWHPHSNILAWKIPRMEEPGRLQSMGSLSQTWLSNFTFTFHFHALEKEMATHSSVLAWRIPGTGDPGGLPSVRLHRVGHDCSDLAAAWSLSQLLKSATVHEISHRDYIHEWVWLCSNKTIYKDEQWAIWLTSWNLLTPVLYPSIKIEQMHL